MLRRRPVRPERFADLLRVAAASPPAEGPPAALETRLLAFAEGAAARAARRRPLLPLLVGATVAAACVALVWLALPGAQSPSPRPAPALPVEPPPVATPVAPRLAPTPDPVVRALRDAPDWRSRHAAAERVGPGPEADLALARALADDPNWRVREAALRALRDRPGREAALALARATEDPHLGIRLGAVGALARRLDYDFVIVEALLRRLERDPDWRVRETALGLLLRSPHGQRAAALALADRHRRLRDRARRALAALE